MELLNQFKEIRDKSLQQVKSLKTEDFVVQPVEFVSPVKWNLAHTTWFFEEFILKNYHKNYKIFNKDFSFLFNSYYVNVGERLTRGHRGQMTRPTVEEIMNYRRYVDREMYKLLKETDPEFMDLVRLGLNHEQQHQELFLSDIKYILGTQPLFPEYSEIALCESGKVSKASWIDIQEGIYEIGYKGKDFHYDNETSRHKVYLEFFRISDQLVSNEEYLEFISSGGYQEPDFWHSDGYAWIQKEKVTAPLYWHKKGSEWYYYTLSGLKKINPLAPVTHVSYYEAYAFAQWKGVRLPTEFEWEASANKFKWGERWEWTESAYLPYPGFKKLPGAIGEYNGKFMVNQKVLRGSSVATSPGHSRKTYRNFFHPESGWQFTGIRLAR